MLLHDSLTGVLTARVSLLTTRNLPYIPASITYNRPIGQARYGQSAPACLRKGFAIIQQARHSYQPNQVHFRLGLQVHFQLLPTPPCGDAVTFSCAPGLVRKRPDFHGLISCFRNRTVPPLHGGNHPPTQTLGVAQGWYLLRLQRIFRLPFMLIRVYLRLTSPCLSFRLFQGHKYHRTIMRVPSIFSNGWCRAQFR